MRTPVACLLLALAFPAAAAPVQQPHSEAELLPERAALVPGQTLTIGLHLRLESRV